MPMADVRMGAVSAILVLEAVKRKTAVSMDVDPCKCTAVSDKYKHCTCILILSGAIFIMSIIQ